MDRRVEQRLYLVPAPKGGEVVARGEKELFQALGKLDIAARKGIERLVPGSSMMIEVGDRASKQFREEFRIQHNLLPGESIPTELLRDFIGGSLEAAIRGQIAKLNSLRDEREKIKGGDTL